MYIKKIEIKNIRAISDFKMEFAEGKEAGWHVLIGDNGVGKSSIVRAVALSIIGPADAQALRLQLKDWIQRSQEEAEIILAIQRDQARDGYAGKKAPLKRPFALSVKISREKNAGFEIGRLSGHGHYGIDPYQYVWSGKPGWFAASFGPFRRFTGGDKEWSKVYYSTPRAAPHLSVFGEDVALTESIEWLSRMKFKSFEENTVAADSLESIKKFINEGGLLPHGTRLAEVSSEGVFFQDGSGFEVDVNQMGDGYRSLLSMIFELIRQMIHTYGGDEVFREISKGTPIIPLPGVVLIDEIDAHLHPTWQTRIGQWFTKYFPNLQFIVTTHSPLICRGCLNEKGEINGSIWYLPAPGSNEKGGQLSDADRDRLIFGNVLDAYGTGAFGDNVERTPASQELLKELAQLDKLHTFGQITPEQDRKRLQLQKIFTTDVIAEF